MHNDRSHTSRLARGRGQCLAPPPSADRSRFGRAKRGLEARRSEPRRALPSVNERIASEASAARSLPDPSAECAARLAKFEHCTSLRRRRALSLLVGRGTATGDRQHPLWQPPSAARCGSRLLRGADGRPAAVVGSLLRQPTGNCRKRPRIRVRRLSWTYGSTPDTRISSEGSVLAFFTCAPGRADPRRRPHGQDLRPST